MNVKQLLTWRAASILNDVQLSNSIGRLYRDGRVRFAAQKVDWAVHNRRIILEHGGPEAFKNDWIQAGFQASLDMLCRFAGIGPKYARNIGMIAVDPRFEDCVALDVRILKLARHVNPALPTRRNWYCETEDYLRGVADRIGISLWQLDRTMFWQHQELGRRLGCPTRSRRSKGRCKAASNALLLSGGGRAALAAGRDRPTR